MLPCCRSLEEDPEPEINKDTLRQCLQGSLAQVFGKIGGAIPFEVLSLQQSNRVAFLKADKRYHPIFSHCIHLA